MGAQQQGANVAKEGVREAVLQTGPSSSSSSERHAALVEQLRPSFAALPKNEQGRLDPATVRYVLHRHFVRAYGWYVKGLDPEGSGWNISELSAPSAEVQKEKAATYIQMLLASRQGEGMDLAGLAVFAVTLEDLIFQDGVGGFRETYAKMGLPTDQAVPDDKFELAMRAYLSQ